MLSQCVGYISSRRRLKPTLSRPTLAFESPAFDQQFSRWGHAAQFERDASLFVVRRIFSKFRFDLGIHLFAVSSSLQLLMTFSNNRHAKFLAKR